MDDQLRRTRAFVAAHVLGAHEESDGCMVCVAFGWGKELDGLDAGDLGELLSAAAETVAVSDR